MQKSIRLFLAVGLLCVAPLMVCAQQTNEGASLTAPFAVVPPVIDGQNSPGEWDGAGVAGGQWSSHSSTDPENPDIAMTVKVMYGIKGIYVLFENADTNPVCNLTGSERLQSGPNTSPVFANTGAVGVDWTGYRTVYLDPTGPVGTQSFSIQGFPSMSVKGESDHNGNSYNYTEIGTFAGRRTRWTNVEDAMADQELPAEEVVYWAGGGSWDLHDTRIADGMKPDGSGLVMEFCIAYSDLAHGFYTGYAGPVADNLADINLAGDEFLDEDGNGIPDTSGLVAPTEVKSFVTGMPAPGTVWEANFGTNTGGDGLWVNWVGDNSGFATEPFGTIIFGEATETAVRDAIMHELANQ